MRLLCKLGLHKWMPYYTWVGGRDYYCDRCEAEK